MPIGTSGISDKNLCSVRKLIQRAQTSS